MYGNANGKKYVNGCHKGDIQRVYFIPSPYMYVYIPAARINHVALYTFVFQLYTFWEHTRANISLESSFLLKSIVESAIFNRNFGEK